MNRQTSNAFVLVEVLLSMTILAISGTVLLSSIMNSMEATRIARDTSKMFFLCQSKLHEFELDYSNKAQANLGEFRGRFDEPGAADFRWKAVVEQDREKDTYFITVWTQWGDEDRKVKSRRRSRFRGEEGFMLCSMVPTARINEDLLHGVKPSKRERGQSRYQPRRGR